MSVPAAVRWERLRPQVRELPAQRLVAPLRRLQDLRPQRLQLVLHAAERRACAAFEGGVDRWDGLDDYLHAGVDLLTRIPEGALYVGREQGLQQLVQRVLVLCLQRFEGDVVLRQESDGRRIDQRGRRAWLHQRHRHAKGFVDAAQLRKVGQLIRAGDVATLGNNESCTTGAAGRSGLNALGVARARPTISASGTTTSPTTKCDPRV